MNSLQVAFERRAQTLARRIDGLVGLRAVVGLPRTADIAPAQWRAIETLFAGVHQRLRERLDRATREWLAPAVAPPVARRLNAAMGALELDLARAYSAFDLYADVLTQRHGSELGELLAGCDVLARAAMRRDHPALRSIAPPLVYCDRGFGASIIREGVRLGRHQSNAVPLIQIPYSRLNSEKYNLTSVLHEAGHQALAQLDLYPELRALMRRAVAEPPLQRLFELWVAEIGPDFWGFGLAGMAQAGSLKEILALPPAQVLHVAAGDPHPPPYLRALLSFEWCRQLWGRGPWDDWERDWLTLYPLPAAAPLARLLERGRRVLPTVAAALLEGRFATLGGRPLATLFDLELLAPLRLERALAMVDSGALRLAGLPAGVQLAVFRLLRERGGLSEAALDRTMSAWLRRLGRRAPRLVHPRPSDGRAPLQRLASLGATAMRRVAVVC